MPENLQIEKSYPDFQYLFLLFYYVVGFSQV